MGDLYPYIGLPIAFVKQGSCQHLDKAKKSTYIKDIGCSTARRMSDNQRPGLAAGAFDYQVAGGENRAHRPSRQATVAIGTQRPKMDWPKPWYGIF